MLFYIILAASFLEAVGVCLFADFFYSIEKALLILPLWLGFFILSLIVYGIVLFAICFFVDDTKPLKKINPFFQTLTAHGMGLALKLLRVRVHCTGIENIPSDSRYLMVCNHRFLLDPLVILTCLKKPDLAFIMKQEVQKMPVCGKLGYLCGGLYIDRNDVRSAVKTIADASAILRQGSVNMCIFPEGGTNHADELKDFRNGAFKVAQKSGVPIVVSAIHGTDMIFKNFPLKRSDVYYTVVGTVDAAFVAEHSTVETGARVRVLMEQGVESLRKH